MINVRMGVFETNSSSTHSLVVSKKDRGYTYDFPVDEYGVLTVPFGEFGWGPDILSTPLEKLSYYITDHGGSRYDDDDRTWDDLLEEISKNEKINDVIKLVKSKCPRVKEIVFKQASSYYPRGYVDHDSVGTSNGVSPEELIFNNGILVIIDNDNNCHFSDFMWEENGMDKEALFDRPADEILEEV